jgi:hypothetical protein
VNGHASVDGNGPAAAPTGNEEAARSGAGLTTSGGAGTNGAGSRPATPSQVRALYAIARSQRIELSQFLYDRFGLRRANDLSIKQASVAIDALNECLFGELREQ